VITGPGDQTAAIAAGRAHLRAAHADRDQMIDMLKAAFVEGRLTKREFDARVSQTLASRTYAELAMVTAGIPARPPVLPPPRRRIGHAGRWGVSGLVTPAILAAAIVFSSVPGDGAYGAVAFVVAFVYFMSWLATGTEMLWQWFSVALPTSRPCVRCAHTVTAHRAPASCAIRRCSCTGYVPPGLSPKAVDLGRA
jgi:Domain of unknown function (DUF1707)